VMVNETTSVVSLTPRRSLVRVQHRPPVLAAVGIQSAPQGHSTLRLAPSYEARQRPRRSSSVAPPPSTTAAAAIAPPMMTYVIVFEPLSSFVLAGAELSDSPFGAGSSVGFSQSGQLVGGPPAPPAPIVISAVKVLTGSSPSGVFGFGSQASPSPSKSVSCWLPVGWS